MAYEMTWKEAINQVLGQFPGGLHYNEIAEKIIEQGLRKSVGATPAATVNAQIASSIKHDGSTSLYVRVNKGVFALKSGLSPMESAHLAAESPQLVEQDEAQSQIISAFGMYWRRDAVAWKNNPRLWGYSKECADKVDFGGQKGIYLLHDGREVVYVGRSTDGSIGKRLLDHTKNRLSFRWDRFSWFGLNPVGESGVLGPIPSNYSADNMIATLEAILIEAMEPRLNRQRGQELGESEYFQHEDPELKTTKLMNDFASVLAKGHL
ncbi:MAG: HTH domain-containing protein [Burkholderiaceae bacterium]|nr:HTH domain-containing protein [Burkholderiaceae bacterium]